MKKLLFTILFLGVVLLNTLKAESKTLTNYYYYTNYNYRCVCLVAVYSDGSVVDSCGTYSKQTLEDYWRENSWKYKTNSRGEAYEYNNSTQKYERRPEDD